jgi:hypothetical protein
MQSKTNELLLADSMNDDRKRKITLNDKSMMAVNDDDEC